MLKKVQRSSLLPYIKGGAHNLYRKNKIALIKFNVSGIERGEEMARIKVFLEVPLLRFQIPRTVEVNKRFFIFPHIHFKPIAYLKDGRSMICLEHNFVGGQPL